MLWGWMDYCCCSEGRKAPYPDNLIAALIKRQIDRQAGTNDEKERQRERMDRRIE
jgi:hypothetical protein